MSPSGSGYFICIKKLIGFTRFNSGGLHEKDEVATWNVGKHLSICLYTQENEEKPVSGWPVAGPSDLLLLASSPASKLKTALHK